MIKLPVIGNLSLNPDCNWIALLRLLFGKPGWYFGLVIPINCVATISVLSLECVITIWVGADCCLTSRCGLFLWCIWDTDRDEVLGDWAYLDEGSSRLIRGVRVIHDHFVKQNLKRGLTTCRAAVDVAVYKYKSGHILVNTPSSCIRGTLAKTPSVSLSVTANDWLAGELLQGLPLCGKWAPCGTIVHPRLLHTSRVFCVHLSRQRRQRGDDEYHQQQQPGTIQVSNTVISYSRSISHQGLSRHREAPDGFILVQCILYDSQSVPL
jgi:hypothetical protein